MLGAVAVTGLPFASPVLGVMTTGWSSSFSGVSGTIQGTLASGAQTVSLSSASGGASSNLINSNFTNSSQLIGKATYET